MGLWRSKPSRDEGKQDTAVTSVPPAVVTHPEALRHPIVLQHGIFGWGRLAKDLEYFRGVQQYLESKGHIVFTPVVKPLGGVRERALDMEAQIKARFPGQQVHLIGHSEGGLDSRYLVQGRDHHVSAAESAVFSVTTLCSPHRGTLIAKVAATLQSHPDEFFRDDAILSALATTLEDLPEQWARFVVLHPETAFKWDRTVMEAQLTLLKNLLVHRDKQAFAKYLHDMLQLPSQAVVDMSPDNTPGLYDESRVLDVPCFSYRARATPFENLAPELILLYFMLQAMSGNNSDGNDGAVPVESAPWASYREEFQTDHNGVHGWYTAGTAHFHFFDVVIANIRAHVPNA